MLPLKNVKSMRFKEVVLFRFLDEDNINILFLIGMIIDCKGEIKFQTCMLKMESYLALI